MLHKPQVQIDLDLKQCKNAYEGYNNVSVWGYMPLLLQFKHPHLGYQDDRESAVSCYWPFKLSYIRDVLYLTSKENPCSWGIILNFLPILLMLRKIYKVTCQVNFFIAFFFIYKKNKLRYSSIMITMTGCSSKHYGSL